MNRKLILSIALVCMIVFIIVGGYFWYLYFNDNESKIKDDNLRLELLNNGDVSYINAISNDTKDNIPTYYFKVKNHLDFSANYVLVFEEVSPQEANDGCSKDTYFKKEELLYELTLDNKIIKKGTLIDLKNNILDENLISGKETNVYSLTVYLKNDLTDILKKHYHYRITLKENNEESN